MTFHGLISNMDIVIKQFAGIGDCLLGTPAIHVIKQAYPSSFITYNTNHAGLLEGNPWIDKIGTEDKGVRPFYTAPASGEIPTQHHIIAAWKHICTAYGLDTEHPALKPEIYLEYSGVKSSLIGVQVLHKGLWHRKKIWPYFDELAKQSGFQPIPKIVGGDVVQKLVQLIASYQVVVCAEGGISHIAQAAGTPAVVLYGGFANPAWNGYVEQTNIESRVDCSYCYNLSPCKGDYKCWRAISVDYVRKTALGLLK